jgi:hypothetical protein
MHDMVEQRQGATTIFIEDRSAIHLCKNPVLHDKSKHIELRYHYIRECIEAGKISVDYVSTGEQLIDILTKPLGCTRFLELRAKIGMVDIKTNS